MELQLQEMSLFQLSMISKLAKLEIEDREVQKEDVEINKLKQKAKVIIPKKAFAVYFWIYGMRIWSY